MHLQQKEMIRLSEGAEPHPYMFSAYPFENKDMPWSSDSESLSPSNRHSNLLVALFEGLKENSRTLLSILVTEHMRVVRLPRMATWW